MADVIEVQQQNVTGAVLKLVQAVQAGDEGRRGLEYWIDECIVKGANAVIRSRKHAADARNQRLFTEEIERDATILTNPEKLQALAKKYGIGSSK